MWLQWVRCYEEGQIIEADTEHDNIIECEVGDYTYQRILLDLVE